MRNLPSLNDVADRDVGTDCLLEAWELHGCGWLRFSLRCRRLSWSLFVLFSVRFVAFRFPRFVSLRFYGVSVRSSSFLPSFFFIMSFRFPPFCFISFRFVLFHVISCISVRFCCVSRDFVFRFVLFVSFRFVRFCCPCFCPDLALRTLWCKVHEA